MGCERCWNDAYTQARMSGQSQADVYRQLLDERKDDPCTPEQQVGRAERDADATRSATIQQ